MLEKAKIKIIEEIDKQGFIDNSDNTDRFLDKLARGIVEQEVLKGSDDIELYYEKESEIEELTEDLLEKIKDYMNKNYNRKGLLEESGDYQGCYYKTIKDFIKWSKTWIENSLQDAYIEFIDKYNLDIAFKEFAVAYDENEEDYKQEKITIGNNLEKILDDKGISIRKMSIDLDVRYATAHDLVKRESLATTPLERIVEIASYLNVSIEELYEE